MSTGPSPTSTFRLSTWVTPPRSWRAGSSLDSEGTPSFEFPSWVLETGAAVRVYTNEVHPDWGGFSFGRGTAVWNNSQPDTALLYDRAGRLVSTATYPPACD